MFKKTCANCHFFIRTHHPANGARHTMEINRELRKRAAKGDLSWQRDSESISCHRGIWDEGVGFAESSKLEQTSKLNRGNKCYYMPYQPGMLLPAAEKLQDARLKTAKNAVRCLCAIADNRWPHRQATHR